MKGAMNWLRLAACGLGVVMAVSCETSTLPSAEKIDAYEKQLRQQAQPEFDDLDRMRAGGQISQEEYAFRKQGIEARIVSQARDAAWTKHSIAEYQRKNMGIPTPDQPVAAPTPGSGAVSESFLRSYKQAYGEGIGMMQNPLSQGYTPGGSIIGNNPRSY